MGSKNFVTNHLLIILGIIWLCAAAGILAYSILNPPNITLEWDTQTEQNTAGFQIYRSTAIDGDFELVSAEMIPSQGSAITGGTYLFEDKNIMPGETYYYLLEEIETDSTTNQYREDIISRRVAPMNSLAIILVALSSVVGIALIVSGLREGEKR